MSHYLKQATLLMWLLASSAFAQPPQVLVAELRGPVSPASADHIVRAIRQADTTNARLLILTMDTPGGLDAAMRTVVSNILAANTPIATWVGPSGARAASAGTYILTASHIAAMASATNVGSSTPVALGNNGENLDNKIINDASAYLQSLAELRGRNQEWAVATVTRGENLTATQALEAGVIDLIADSLPELLSALHGRSVTLPTGLILLDTTDAEVTSFDTDWRHNFLNIITNPNIAYLLLIIGFYGLILEFYSPGFGIAGVTGVICLLLAGYALQMLPVSYAGAALLLLGISLMIFEATTPSFGLAGLGGLLAFVLGSVMLMDTQEPAWQISLALIGALAVSTAGLIAFVIGAAIRARHRPRVSGNEALLGQLAVAAEDFESEGHVMLHGEIWRARCSHPVKKGQSLQIDQIDGLTLITRHASPSSAEPVQTH